MCYDGGMRVLVVGCGYVGLPLGVELVRQGHEVHGLRRTAGAAEALRAAGLTPWEADITRPAELQRLPRDFDWVVNTAAPAGSGPEDYRRVYLEGTRNLVAWLSATPLGKYVYTSSTGVYGQDDGSWVDEASPTQPLTAQARVLVEAEQHLLTAARERGFPAVILRVAGIYGPGRGHLFKQFVAGQATLAGAGRRCLNQIHRDDLIGLLLAALEHGRPGEIYNAADDEPVTQADFFRWLAERLGRPPPPAVPDDADARRGRGLTHKRVANRKAKSALAYRFIYPTFREGYRAEIERLAL
jgi:nucleoside-diphosphate-sugar epimerase